MPPPNPAVPDDFWWADPSLKARVLTDPAAVLRDRGINVPAHLPPHVLHEVVRIVMILWVDGRLVPVNHFHIDPLDEGLLFGRGVWESTRTIDGVPWLWPEHLARLLNTAKLLELEIDPKRLPDAAAVTQYVRALSPQDVVLRLNVSAGRPGQRGLVWMSAGLRPMAPPQLRLQTRRTSVQRDLPYTAWKTFHYAHRLRTNKQSFDAGYDGALTLDEHDNIQEAAHANIFFRFADGWRTPPAAGGLLLPGTVRQLVLDKAPISAREEIIPKSRINDVLEAFVTNSNVGIVPVTQIDGKQLTPGTDTLTLIRWLDPKSAAKTG